MMSNRLAILTVALAACGPTRPLRSQDAEDMSQTRSGSMSLDLEQGDWATVRVVVDEPLDRWTVAIEGGSGDADLYVAWEDEPGPDVWDCRPYLEGSYEECVFEEPAQGVWIVSVHAYTTVRGATLRWHGEEAAPQRVVMLDTLLGELEPGDVVEQRFDVPESVESFEFHTDDGWGDVTLTLTDPDGMQTCRSDEAGTTQVCGEDRAFAGSWLARIEAHVASGDVSLYASGRSE